MSRDGGHGWVTENQHRFPIPSPVYTACKVFSRYISNVILKTTPAFLIPWPLPHHKGSLAATLQHRPSPRLYPFPSTQLPDSRPETHTDLETLLLTNLPWLPATCRKSEGQRGTPSLLRVACSHFWFQPRWTLSLHALIHAHAFPLGKPLLFLSTQLTLAHAFSGTQSNVASPLRFPGASSSCDFTISFHPGDLNAEGLLPGWLRSWRVGTAAARHRAQSPDTVAGRLPRSTLLARLPFCWVPGAACLGRLGKPQLAPFPVLHIRADLLCPRPFLSGDLLIWGQSSAQQRAWRNRPADFLPQPLLSLSQKV